VCLLNKKLVGAGFAIFFETHKMNLKELSEKMADIDICMMTTTSASNELTSRPMSNNGDVEYDGNSYFFTYGDSHVAMEISGNAQVNLSFATKKHVYISVSGEGKLVTDKNEMKEHWNKDLEVWFKDGIDTPGITMIHVEAKKIKYWEDMEEGEVQLP
jgi:general stress protein 26